MCYNLAILRVARPYTRPLAHGARRARRLVFGLCLLTALLARVASVGAQVILSPVAVLQNTGGQYSSDYSINNAINQSGLSIPFTSGETDFNEYIARNPTHNITALGNEWWTPDGTTSTTVIFDLGRAYDIDRLALWNEDADGIATVSVETSNDPTFATATAVGSFSPVNNPVYVNYPAEVFTLTPSKGRYVRLNISGPQSSALGTQIAVGEIAFSVTERLPEIKSIRLEPATGGLNINLRDSAYLRAIGTYDDDTERDVTNIVEWVYSTDEVGEVYNTGEFRSFEVGNTTVFAAYRTADTDVFSNGANVTVNGPISISILPQLEAGQTALNNDVRGAEITFSAIGLFADGNVSDISQSVIWFSDDADYLTRGSSTGPTAVPGSFTVNEPAGRPTNLSASVFAQLGSLTSPGLQVSTPQFSYNAGTDLSFGLRFTQSWSAQDGSWIYFMDGSPAFVCQSQNPTRAATAFPNAYSKSYQFTARVVVQSDSASAIRAGLLAASRSAWFGKDYLLLCLEKAPDGARSVSIYRYPATADVLQPGTPTRVANVPYSWNALQSYYLRMTWQTNRLTTEISSDGNNWELCGSVGSPFTDEPAWSVGQSIPSLYSEGSTALFGDMKYLLR